MRLLIQSVLLPKTLSIVRQKNATTALGKWVLKFSRFGLPIATEPFGSSAQVICEEAGKSMKSKLKYSDEPIGKLRVVNDFLPPPEDLVFKEENVKVTMSLSRASVNFFKNEAKKNHTSYQLMIRKLVDIYASQFSKPLTTRSSGRGKKRRAA